MAFSADLVKEWYKDLSVEELEKRYKALEANFYFETKESAIKYIIDNCMDASHTVNISSTRKGLEELLKEKTGKEYKMRENKFVIGLNDIVDYLANNTKLLPDKAGLMEFFGKIKDVTEGEAMAFLIYLMQSKEDFRNFLVEVKNTKNPNDLYDKYSIIASEYFSMNQVMG